MMIHKTTPCIDDSGNIIIPFNSDPKYQYWNGGQPLSVTLQEMNITEDVWKKHTEKPYPESAV
jgi:hypothetical protein